MSSKQAPETSHASISSAAASPVRTSAPQARAQVSPLGPAAVCGSSSVASSPSYPPPLSSSRTLPTLEAGNGCPRCGGTCTCLDTIPPPTRFVDLTSGARRGDPGSSLWPTVVVTDSRSSGRATTTTGIMNPGTSLTDATRATYFRLGLWNGTMPRPVLNPLWVEQIMGFPGGWTESEH